MDVKRCLRGGDFYSNGLCVIVFGLWGVYFLMFLNLVFVYCGWFFVRYYG